MHGPRSSPCGGRVAAAQKQKIFPFKSSSVAREYYYEGPVEQETIMMAPIEKPQPAAWKLYDNPHFSHPYKCLSKSRSSLHTCNFSDFFRAMDREPNLSDLDNAIAHIKQLKAELEFERRMRRKVELLNRTLARELEEERRRRECAEEACRKLADEIVRVREEAERSEKEAEDERRMLRMAEVWREERVQMKLAEARLLMEEKIIEASCNNKESKIVKSATDAEGLQKKEVENPHIKRGIKGLEFPRAVRVRAGGGSTGSSPSSNSREGRGSSGSNLECQRAQLRVLLRQRNPAGSGLMGAAHSLVM